VCASLDHSFPSFFFPLIHLPPLPPHTGTGSSRDQLSALRSQVFDGWGPGGSGETGSPKTAAGGNRVYPDPDSEFTPTGGGPVGVEGGRSRRQGEGETGTDVVCEHVD
jgi:hypothetical protein